MLKSNTLIQGYHSHIYFDADTLAQAECLIHDISDLCPMVIGRVHQKPVGPHPMWSCQIAYGAEWFATIMPWLALNRDGLIVFTHPMTGDDLADHRDYAIWMGQPQPLNLSIFA